MEAVTIRELSAVLSTLMFMAASGHYSPNSQHPWRGYGVETIISGNVDVTLGANGQTLEVSPHMAMSMAARRWEVNGTSGTNTRIRMSPLIKELSTAHLRRRFGQCHYGGRCEWSYC